MIPRLVPRDAPSTLTTEFLAELQLRGFEGDTSRSHADRTVFATDNSVYQVAPQAIVFPRNEQDVARVAKLSSDPRFESVTFTPRGGGTGTNGQSLTGGISVDLSRYMNAILEINVEERWVRVQAGVVKDQLNDAVRQHGLFFAPELSPSNRATIGGMIATDASGQGSVLYGKTRDHVLELNTVLLDGTPWHSRPLSPPEFDSVKRREDRIGVWVRRPEKGDGHEDKIAALGIRVRKWVTLHGIAVNVEPDLTHFTGIVPCGVSEQRYGVTSLADLVLAPSMIEVDMAMRRD